MLSLLLWSGASRVRAEDAYQAALARSLAAHEAGDYARARVAMEEAHALSRDFFTDPNQFAISESHAHVVARAYDRAADQFKGGLLYAYPLSAR